MTRMRHFYLSSKQHRGECYTRVTKHRETDKHKREVALCVWVGGVFCVIFRKPRGSYYLSVSKTLET